MYHATTAPGRPCEYLESYLCACSGYRPSFTRLGSLETGCDWSDSCLALELQLRFICQGGVGGDRGGLLTHPAQPPKASYNLAQSHDSCQAALLFHLSLLPVPLEPPPHTSVNSPFRNCSSNCPTGQSEPSASCQALTEAAAVHKKDKDTL